MRACCVWSLLTGVDVLDAVALVLERRVVGAGQVFPAAVLAVVLGRCASCASTPWPSWTLLTMPTAGLIRDHERDRVIVADPGVRVRGDERGPVRVQRAAEEDRARVWLTVPTWPAPSSAVVRVDERVALGVAVAVRSRSACSCAANPPVTHVAADVHEYVNDRPVTVATRSPLRSELRVVHARVATVGVAVGRVERGAGAVRD